MNILLPTSYFAPVSYYAQLLRADAVTIELYEHFPKQTWRNRCSIYSPNGIQHLLVPLSGRKDKSLTKDIGISNDRNWQLMHWRSLEAAYRSSPYFEYYEDDLRPFFERKFDSLVELNTGIMRSILELLKIKKEFSFSTEYIGKPAEEDLRDILAKRNVMGTNFPRYMQVFENKAGFLSNLSIADLLFNQGPQSAAYLAQLSLK
jgi:hypothetical protein